MSLTKNDVAIPYRRLGQALDCLLRPAVGFHTPFDVLKDPLIDVSEKRAILASWASDASAVENHPTLRWLLGTDEPVPLGDVLEALWRLDRSNPAEAEHRTPPSPPCRNVGGIESDPSAGRPKTCEGRRRGAAAGL